MYVEGFFQGYVLKFGNKYVAWNSFKATPYMSDLNHSEAFWTKEKAIAFKDKYKLCVQICKLVAGSKSCYLIAE